MLLVAVAGSTITTISSASREEALASCTWRPLRPRRGLLVVKVEEVAAVVVAPLICSAICWRSLAACTTAILMAAVSEGAVWIRLKRACSECGTLPVAVAMAVVLPVVVLLLSSLEQREAVWLLVILGGVAVVLAAVAAVVEMVFLPPPGS